MNSWEDIVKEHSKKQKKIMALTPPEDEFNPEDFEELRDGDVELMKMDSWEDILKRKKRKKSRGRTRKKGKSKGKPKSAYKKKLERARTRMKKLGLEGFNKPKALRDDSGKSHHVMAKEGSKIRYIKFGQAGVKTNQTRGQQRAFKSRHGKDIKRGRMSGAYWANDVKWNPKKTKEKKNKKWRKGS